MTFKFAAILLLICSYIVITCGLLSASFVKIIYWKINVQVRWCISVNITIWGVIHTPEGFSGSSTGKELACSAGDPGSIPRLGRSPGEGNGYPL